MCALFSVLMTPTGANELSIDAALKTFQQAASGDKAAVGQGIEQYKALLRLQPTQVMYKARLGSLTTMLARDAWAPWKKMSYTEQGLEYIDIALDGLTAKHQQQQIGGLNVAIDVRYTAVVTFSNLPDFFHRWGHAERLLAQITEEANFTESPGGFQAEVWLLRARLAQKRDRISEYQRYLKKVLAVDADSAAGKQAQYLLAEASK